MSLLKSPGDPGRGARYTETEAGDFMVCHQTGSMVTVLIPSTKQGRRAAVLSTQKPKYVIRTSLGAQVQCAVFPISIFVD